MTRVRIPTLDPETGKVAAEFVPAETDPAASAALTTAVATLGAAIAAKQDSATAASDAELASAVATLIAGIATKQDAATAATDAELASAIATLNAAMATDAELASAVAALSTSIGLKQDALTAATDAELAAAVAAINAVGATDAEVAAAVASEAGLRTAADSDLSTRVDSVGSDSVTLTGAQTVDGPKRLAAGLVVSEYGTVDRPTPRDVVLGHPPQGSSAGARGPVGFHFDDLNNKIWMGGTNIVHETDDPPELAFRHSPGKFPRGPTGPIALLAADVAPGATAFYCHTQVAMPTAGDTFGAASVFKVGSQVIAWTGRNTVQGRLPIASLAGATEILLAQATENLPTAGIGQLSGGTSEVISWAGNDLVWTGTLAGAALAGDTEIQMSSGDGAALVALGVTSGQVMAETALGYQFLVKFGAVDTSLDKLTSVGASGGNILRNLAIGTALKLRKLIGVRHIAFMDTPVTSAATSGATEIELSARDSAGTLHLALLPVSGSARLHVWNSATVLTISWTGRDLTARKLTGVTGVSAAVPVGSGLTYADLAGTVGTGFAHAANSQVSIGKHSAASGFAAGASAGAFVEYSIRELCPTPDNTNIGYTHWAARSPGGFQNFNASDYARTHGDSAATDRYGGTRHIGVTSQGPGSFRMEKLLIRGRGIGVLGGRITDRDGILWPLHVAGPGCRAAEQRASTTITVIDTTIPMPSSGRITTTAWHRVTNAEVTVEFDYASLGADNKTLTGVTYDGTGGYVLTDFFLAAPNISLAARTRYAAIVSKLRIRADEGLASETWIGGVGPSTTDPEPGVRLGLTLPLDIYRGADGKVHTLRNSVDSTLATEAYADALIAANDAMVFRGVIDAGTNPNYPAADRGHTHKIGVAGKIGGASGVTVEVGDLAICTVDSTVAGTQAAVGASWAIIQANIDGAVTGPASAVSANLASFVGASGKVLGDAGVAVDTDATLAADSDARLATQKAVKAALAGKAPLASPALTGTPTVPTAAQGTSTTQAASTAFVATEAGLLIPKSLIDAKGDIVVGTADNTVTRKAVGSAGYALVADPASSDGLGWMPRGLGHFWRVGEWQFNGHGAGSNSLSNGQMWFGRFDAPVAMTLSEVGTQIVTLAASGGGVLRFGLCMDLDGDGIPDHLVSDIGTVVATSTGAAQITGLSVMVPQGPFWVGMVQQGAPATNATTQCITSTPGYPRTTAFSDITQAGPAMMRQTGVTGALADPTGLAWVMSSNLPKIGCKRSA